MDRFVTCSEYRPQWVLKGCSFSHALIVMITLEDIKRAQQRLRGVAFRTPLIAYFPCAQKADANRGQLWFKAENLQPIGSFKLRGAYNKIASLTDEERRRGVISYSSGNHAQGVAYAARA